MEEAVSLLAQTVDVPPVLFTVPDTWVEGEHMRAILRAGRRRRRKESKKRPRGSTVTWGPTTDMEV